MDFEDVEHIGIAVSVIIGLIVLGRYLINGINRTTKLYGTIEGDPVSGQDSFATWRKKIEAALLGEVSGGTTSPGILQQVGEIKQTLTEHEATFKMIKDELTLTANGEQSIKNLVTRTHRDLQEHLNQADDRQRETMEHMHAMREALIKQGFELPSVPSSHGVDEFASFIGLGGRSPARSDKHGASSGEM